MAWRPVHSTGKGSSPTAAVPSHQVGRVMQPEPTPIFAWPYLSAGPFSRPLQPASSTPGISAASALIPGGSVTGEYGPVSLLPGGFGLGPGRWLPRGPGRRLLVPIPPDEPVHRYPPRDVTQPRDERDEQQQQGGRTGHVDGDQ